MLDHRNTGADETLDDPASQDVSDDDLDLDDDLEDDPETGEDTPEPEDGDTDADTGKPLRVAPSVRPGPLTRVWQTVSAPFSRIRLPKWDIRMFGWLLLALVILTFFITNWAPMRFYIFGFAVELPKTVAVVVLLAIGFLLGWCARAPKPEVEEEE